MSATEKPQDNQSLNELGKEVHELNYSQIGKSVPSQEPPIDTSKAKELAQKIRKNIESYQGEAGLSQRPHFQAQ